MIVNEACEDSGKCHDDPGKDGEVKNPDVPGFRCVAKELEIDPDADDEPTLSGCELNLQFLGKCFSDCNHNVECTVPRTRKLGDNNKHFLHRKVCCNKSKGCFADADKNKGQIMQIRSAVTWAGLLAVFVRLGALPA
ncbi:uncharacterized protein LOC118434831 [Folsomia candida]|nr:uncharacterized protein LOC118434831 [Folsomia candida]